MEKYVVCDLDNTLLDTLFELEKLVEDYTIPTQYEYVLKDRFLEPFLNGSVYQEVSFNKSVLMVLKELIGQGYIPIFISQTFTNTARLRKHALMIDLYNELEMTNNIPLRIETFDVGIAAVFTELVGKEVIFIDDAPERLSLIYEKFPISTVYKVTYPYNKHIHLNIETIELYSNTYKGEKK